jgi:hypothetical protein
MMDEGLAWRTDDVSTDAKPKVKEESLQAKLLATLDRLAAYLELQTAKAEAREEGRRAVLAALQAMLDKADSTQTRSMDPRWARVLELHRGR